MEIKNFAINTKTQEEYDDLMQLFENNGCIWLFDKALPTNHNNFWQSNKEKTCILMDKEFIIADIDCFLKMNCAIIPFDYFMEITDLKYKPKEMTIKQIEKEVGYKIKIIGEEE